MKAKYYIYRNLHTNNFSVRYRNKVIDHIDEALLFDCTFKVSEKGRQRVLKNKRKNVHATIACKGYRPTVKKEVYQEEEIHYNPYPQEAFVCSGEPIQAQDYVYLTGNKAYKA